jgi:hypothetical protein
MNFQTLRDSAPSNGAAILFRHKDELNHRYGNVIYKWYEYDEEYCSTGISHPYENGDEDSVVGNYRIHLEISEDGSGSSEDYGELDKLSIDILWIDLSGIAHELWSLAQLTPGEGILDGVLRIEECLVGNFTCDTP